VTITRVGKNQKYADGWAAAFGGKAAAKGAAPKTAKKKASPKKSAKKAKK
jgi:hypothetical protein